MAAVWCGIDVSARRGHHLCVLEAHDERLRATFYVPGDTAALARTVARLRPAAVGVDAPSGPCRRLLGLGSEARQTLDLPAGRYERARVCDALLMRRRLSLYPVPAEGESAPSWMEAGFDLFHALAEAAGVTPYRPAARSPYEGATEPSAGRQLFETYPDAAFCALLGHRPPKKSTAQGCAARVAVLADQGITDPGDLEQRSTDELDACIAALTAHRLATGGAGWVGDPDEGVIVLPVPQLQAWYAPAHTAAPARQALDPPTGGAAS
jgi:predicted nuclease with RNAse H fold